MVVVDLVVVESSDEGVSWDIESSIILVVDKRYLSFVGVSPLTASIAPWAIVGIDVPWVSYSDEFFDNSS